MKLKAKDLIWVIPTAIWMSAVKLWWWARDHPRIAGAAACVVAVIVLGVFL